MDVIYKDFLNFWPFYIYFLINYFLIKRKACMNKIGTRRLTGLFTRRQFDVFPEPFMPGNLAAHFFIDNSIA